MRTLKRDRTAWSGPRPGTRFGEPVAGWVREGAADADLPVGPATPSGEGRTAIVRAPSGRVRPRRARGDWMLRRRALRGTHGGAAAGPLRWPRLPSPLRVCVLESFSNLGQLLGNVPGAGRQGSGFSSWTSTRPTSVSCTSSLRHSWNGTGAALPVQALLAPLMVVELAPADRAALRGSKLEAELARVGFELDAVRRGGTLAVRAQCRRCCPGRDPQAALVRGLADELVARRATPRQPLRPRRLAAPGCCGSDLRPAWPATRRARRKGEVPSSPASRRALLESLDGDPLGAHLSTRPPGRSPPLDLAEIERRFGRR